MMSSKTPLNTITKNQVRGILFLCTIVLAFKPFFRQARMASAGSRCSKYENGFCIYKVAGTLRCRNHR